MYLLWWVSVSRFPTGPRGEVAGEQICPLKSSLLMSGENELVCFTASIFKTCRACSAWAMVDMVTSPCWCWEKLKSWVVALRSLFRASYGTLETIHYVKGHRTNSHSLRILNYHHISVTHDVIEYILFDFVQNPPNKGHLLLLDCI